MWEKSKPKTLFKVESMRFYVFLLEHNTVGTTGIYAYGDGGCEVYEIGFSSL